MLTHGERNGLIRWFPVGVIIRGVDHDNNGLIGHCEIDRGENAEFDIIRIRRIHFIRPDGTLKYWSKMFLKVFSLLVSRDGQTDACLPQSTKARPISAV